ncbi:uncharacterized protein LOC123542554 [Mercenaria mercenaria]|uniref:uncharacterized protein LOC123542554 n=1 Tax=Mercenaria mercenaria TaxID=6596 RepID=UPI001E1E0743|nr:uncharacterized protein LOC123542554 [Mercenaria mercenaria]
MAGLKIALLFGCLALAAGRTLIVQKASLSLTEDSEDADELNEILRTVSGYSDVISGEEYDDIVQGCSKGRCKFCRDLHGNDVCLEATLKKTGVVIKVTLDNEQIGKTVVTGPNPPKVCRRSIPGFPAIKDVCLEVKDVNVQQLSGCVYVSFQARRTQFNVKIGCFKIPTSDGVNQIRETELGQVEEHGTRAENEETVVMFEGIDS